MEWQGDGIVLSSSKFGETDALLEVMSRENGRHRGFVKGGSGKRLGPVLQAGNFLTLKWRSRIEENLGRFTVELDRSPLGLIMGDGLRLMTLSAMVSVVSASLPERENHPAVYDSLKAMIEYVERSDVDPAGWAAALVRLEMGILSDLGYGLDLSECAATGSDEDLVYVSPKSARAVSRAAGRPYHDKLLTLPSFLMGPVVEEVGTRAAIEGLNLTGYFLERQVWQVRHRTPPQARERLLSKLVSMAKKSVD
ncbi:DNA repair protein RecO [Kordiimonas sediminis]|uniref:DNA repair protein RecO n=1 Tax=Kordiimonas sediminis TaxID=1735581 RepID=A0A919AWH7_9PROT|nr:DNA repair protein RecO [Kordiimonas sediminis]GHF29639.1 DNA repair protein RecO [Kordiimonas sediminis]